MTSFQVPSSSHAHQSTHSVPRKTPQNNNHSPKKFYPPVPNYHSYDPFNNSSPSCHENSRYNLFTYNNTFTNYDTTQLPSKQLFRQAEPSKPLIESNSKIQEKISSLLEKKILSDELAGMIRSELDNYPENFCKEMSIIDFEIIIELISAMQIDNKPNEIKDILYSYQNLGGESENIKRYSESAESLIKYKVSSYHALSEKINSLEEYIKYMEEIIDYIKKTVDLVQSVKYCIYQNLLNDFKIEHFKYSYDKVSYCFIKELIKKIVESLNTLDLKAFKNTMKEAIYEINGIRE